MELINEAFLFLICNSFILYSVNLQLNQLKNDDPKLSEYIEDSSFNRTNYDLDLYIFMR